MSIEGSADTASLGGVSLMSIKLFQEAALSTRGKLHRRSHLTKNLEARKTKDQTK